jgi:predicted ester cyclase
MIIHDMIMWMNKGDLDSYLKLYDDNVVLHCTQGLEPGIDGVREFHQGFLRAFPGCKYQSMVLIAKADMVTCRFSVRGTHKGEFMGLPPTDKPFKFGITVLKFQDRKCIEQWNEADLLGLLQQLGFILGKT